MDLFLLLLLVAFSVVLIASVRRGEKKHLKVAAFGVALSATDILVTSISLPPLVATLLLASAALVAMFYLSR
jgi:hypothetical protein